MCTSYYYGKWKLQLVLCSEVVHFSESPDSTVVETTMAMLLVLMQSVLDAFCGVFAKHKSMQVTLA